MRFRQHNRAAVYKRDRNHCQRCNRHHPYGNHLTVHHIRARADGGDDSMGNLIALCHGCHDLIEGEGLTSRAAIIGFAIDDASPMSIDPAPYIPPPYRIQHRPEWEPTCYLKSNWLCIAKRIANRKPKVKLKPKPKAKREPDKFIKLKTAALLADTTPFVIYLAIRNGQIRGVRKADRTWAISRYSLYRWMACRLKPKLKPKAKRG